MTVEDSQIVPVFQNQTIFLTGGTGFVGKVLVEKLLRECDLRRIYLLVRPKKNKTSEERFKEIFEFPCFDRIKSLNINIAEKVRLLSGDCTLPQLGLSDDDLEVLKEETTFVIHAAANVRFDQSLVESANIVRCITDVLNLLKQMRKLQLFVHVSTAYSNCIYPHIAEEIYKPPLHAEDFLALVRSLDEDILKNITPGLLGKWPNTYVYAKCIAEDLIKRSTQEIPTIIIRPGIVTNSVAEPIPGWLDNVYGVAGIVLGSGVGIIRSYRADKKCVSHMVPVDYVSNIILAAMWKKQHDTTDTIDIYNYVGDRNNFLDYEGIMKNAQPYNFTYASEKYMWSYTLRLCGSNLEHNIYSFFVHTIPAYIVDFVLICMGKSPKAVNIYDKINKVFPSLCFFSTNHWIFEDGCVKNLWKSMNKTDKQLFNFDMSNLNWPDYFRLMVMGLKMYVVKEPMERSAKATRRFYILKVAHYTLMGLLYYLLFKLVLFIVKLFL